MTQEELDQALSSVRSILIYGSGIMTAVGVQTFANPQDLVTDFDHMVNGAKEFWVGFGPLVGMGVLAWGRYKSSTASKKASLVATPGTMVVQVSGDTTAAATKLAAIPEVHTVLSTPEVASATVSSKVVSS